MLIRTIRRTSPLLATLIVLIAMTTLARAQSAAGDPTDVTFEIVNGTTGEPGTVSRLTVDYMRVRPNTIVDERPSGSTVVARSIPVFDSSSYLVTVWADDVPYWWSIKGRDFKAGPVTLHVFDAVAAAEDVAVTGMDVIVSQRGAVAEVQYLLRVANNARPQVTVGGGEPSLELALPAGLKEVTAVYMRGPEPMPVELESGAGPMTGLVVPLTPGNNQVRIEGIVPWEESLDLKVGASLPVEGWSLLTSPESVEVRGTGFTESREGAVTGYRRFAGDALDAAETVDLSLVNPGVQTTDPQDLFETIEQAGAEGTGDEAEDDSGPNYLPLIFAGLLLIVILGGAFRRRS
jgi:hypothetical protein